jgi:hypothetical protein
MSGASLAIVVLAVVLLLSCGVLVRARSPYPWPAVLLAMVGSGLAFTVGGATAQESSRPAIATVAAAAAGLLSVIGAIVSLVPRTPEMLRVPIYLGCAGTVVAAVGLVLNQLV